MHMRSLSKVVLIMPVKVRLGLAAVAGLALATFAGDRPFHTPAFAQTPAATLGSQLVTASASSDVVSPAGITSVLCGVAPITSSSARRQVERALEVDCSRFDDYYPTSVWLPQSGGFDTESIRELRRHSDVRFGRPPFNSAIDSWIERHDGVPVHIDAPIGFAAVAVLVYSSGWQFPIPRSRSRLGIFHGRDRKTSVTFMSGIGASVERSAGCERTTVPLHNGGELRLAVIHRGDARAALVCLTRSYARGESISARYFIPRMVQRGRTDLTDRLRRLGVTDVFATSKRPFRRLGGYLALDKLLQAVQLRIDETGVGVRATTIAYRTLTIPHPILSVRFDAPFVVQVLDARRVPAAIGVVNDL